MFRNILVILKDIKLITNIFFLIATLSNLSYFRLIDFSYFFFYTGS